MRPWVGILCVLVAANIGACGGEQQHVPPPVDQFTESSARAALERIYTASEPDEFCVYLLPSAERQLIRASRREFGIDNGACAEVLKVAESKRREFPPLADLRAEERDDLRRTVDLEPEERTASFLDQYRIGIVLRLVDGEWRVAGWALGG